MIRDTWHGCYEEGLQDVIVPQAKAHPAKASWALAKRIVQHALAEQWIRPGSLVLDPLAGVGVFGLALAYAGCQAVLGELESHFAALLKQNIEKHAVRLQQLGQPVPWCFRHDARYLPLGGASCVVSSPPFLATQGGEGTSRVGPLADLALKLRHRGGGKSELAYGTHPSQIGTLKSGDIEAVLTSPPYADGCRQTGGIDLHPEHIQGGKNGHVLRSYSQPACVVTSPPYEENMCNGRNGIDWTKTENGTLDRTREPNYAKNGSGVVLQKYGAHDDQIGNTTRETYFRAVHSVYSECHRILPDGAPIILVVKGFIRHGAYVDLPTQTAQLLEYIGFEVVHWHEAMLVSRESQLGLFGGEQRVARKSFFRRLHEKKFPGLAIDAEIVLCAVKTATPTQQEGA